MLLLDGLLVSDPLLEHDLQIQKLLTLGRLGRPVALGWNNDSCHHRNDEVYVQAGESNAISNKQSFSQSPAQKTSPSANLKKRISTKEYSHFRSSEGRLGLRRHLSGRHGVGL